MTLFHSFLLFSLQVMEELLIPMLGFNLSMTWREKGETIEQGHRYNLILNKDSGKFI